MTRDQVTLVQTPARRTPYPPAAMRGGQQPGAQDLAADTFARDNSNWQQERNNQRLVNHLNLRSNSGDGKDAIRAMAAGETLAVVSLGANLPIRVPHHLQRIPSAVVWVQSPDPTLTVVGNPAGQGGGFPNAAWTVREVFLNTNAAIGTVFQVTIG